MDCKRPGFPVRHQLPELAQTHVHQVGDAIQPSGKEQILISHNRSLSQPLLSAQPEFRIADGTFPLGNLPDNSNLLYTKASLVAQMAKNLPTMLET